MVSMYDASFPKPAERFHAPIIRGNPGRDQEKRRIFPKSGRIRGSLPLDKRDGVDYTKSCNTVNCEEGKEYPEGGGKERGRLVEVLPRPPGKSSRSTGLKGVPCRPRRRSPDIGTGRENAR